MVDNETRKMQFRSLLMLSADTAAQLRPSDVDRVLDAANDQGCLQEFREWLLAHPDLMDRTRSNIEQYEVE